MKGWFPNIFNGSKNRSMYILTQSHSLIDKKMLFYFAKSEPVLFYGQTLSVNVCC